jgi:glyoxylase-like metal-dependent hydrolase (beta-lactamase superfamily II)
MGTAPAIDTTTLQEWMNHNEPVFVLDIRPLAQRGEWQIPGSHHIDAYKRLHEGDTSVLDEIEIPKGKKVVTVCAAGKTSQVAAEVLLQKGIDAYSLEGGMKAWSMAWNVARQQFERFEVLQVRRTGKGCLSYIISSNKEAIIVDASLPVDVYTHLLTKYGLTAKYVIETHIHADHLSRSKELAIVLHAHLYLPTPNKVEFAFNPVTAETKFSIGDIVVKCLPTPGHTVESYTYYIDNQIAITGDTLFTDGVGRPDLKANDEETHGKATLLYQSLRKIISLPKNVLVLPAHTSQPVAFDGKLVAATVDQIKRDVSMLRASEPDFINTLLSKIPPTPNNYLAIVEKNIKGDYSDANPEELEAGANRCAIS